MMAPMSSANQLNSVSVYRFSVSFLVVTIIKIESYFIEIKTYYISERNEDEVGNKVKILIFSLI